MPVGSVDGIIRPRPGHPGKKFRDNPAPSGIFDMLSEHPPAKIPGFLQHRIRAIEKRHLPFNPFLCLFIGNGLNSRFFVIFVKSADVFPPVFSVEPPSHFCSPSICFFQNPDRVLCAPQRRSVPRPPAVRCTREAISPRRRSQRAYNRLPHPSVPDRAR